MSFLPPYQQLLQHSNLRFSKDIYQKAYYAFKPKELYIIDSEYPVYSSNSNDGNADLTNLNQNNISDSIPNRPNLNQVSTKGIFGNNFQQFTYNNTFNRDYLTDNRFRGYISRQPTPTTLSINTYNVDTDENYQTARPDTIPEQNNENEEDFFHQTTDNPIQPQVFNEESTRDSAIGTSVAAPIRPAKSFEKLENPTKKKKENKNVIANYIIKLEERGVKTPKNTGFEVDGIKYVYTGDHGNGNPKIKKYDE